MRYMLLIYGDEKANAGRAPEEMEAMMGTWFKYTEDLRNSGKMIAGDALQPTTLATTIRAAANGPFDRVQMPPPNHSAAQLLRRHRLSQSCRLESAQWLRGLLRHTGYRTLAP